MNLERYPQTNHNNMLDVVKYWLTRVTDLKLIKPVPEPIKVDYNNYIPKRRPIKRRKRITRRSIKIDVNETIIE